MYKQGEEITAGYRYLATLGKGGMGEVYLVEHEDLLGKKRAMKRLSRQKNREIDLLAERDIMVQLEHPALPEILNIFDEEDAVYIVMDYIEGKTLDQIIKAEMRITPTLVIEWAKQIGEVLAYLHELQPNPIIYRDMKPSNIMVLPDQTIKIIDFGIAREYKQESATDTQYLGTRGYASPEQSMAQGQTDARTDIYSLGVTLYHAVTGRGPSELLEFKPIRQLEFPVPEGSEVVLEALETILMKMMQPDPANRYQSVREVLSVLNEVEKQTLVYKKYQQKKLLKTMSYLLSLLLFLGITFFGYTEMKVERVAAYTSLIDQGTAKLAALEFEQADQLFTEAMQLNEEEIAAYKGIASSLYEQGQYEETVQYIDELFHSVPVAEEEAEMFFLAGSAAYELRDYETASKRFEQANQLAPEVVMYQLNLATALAKNGVLDRSRHLLEEIMSNHPDSEIASYVNGEILVADNALEEGIVYFDHVLDQGTDPYLAMKATLAMSELYEQHASVLVDDKVEKRIDVLERGLKKIDDSSKLLLTESLAKAYYDKAVYEGDNHVYYEKSIEQFEYLLNNGYKRPYIYRNISIIYQNMKRLEEAEAVLKDMQTLYPRDYTVYLQFAFLYAEIENEKSHDDRDYQQVVDHYEQALTYSPEGKDSPEIQPLTKLIEELRVNNWID